MFERLTRFIRKKDFDLLNEIRELKNSLQLGQDDSKKELFNLKCEFDRLNNEFTDLKRTISNLSEDIAISNEATLRDLISLLNNQALENRINIQRQLSIALLHQITFSRFKGINSGKEVALFATGPTIKKFDPSLLPNIINVGVNKAFLYKNVRFDYLFAIDKISIADCIEDFFSYKCSKFIGDQHLGEAYQIPENYLSQKDVLRYKTSVKLFPDIFAQDLESNPLANSCSVAIQAMQFILYTNPENIYLIGNDCTVNRAEHFYDNSETFICSLESRNEPLAENQKNLINSWKQIKTFASLYYPCTKIISVNPVNLKGLFEDITC